jgi:thiosulfate reductase cytochrome b subunit
MTERIFLLPLWIRLWHWSNAALILTLCLTGFSLHFASPAHQLIPFPLAVRIHNGAGLALVALYAFFVLANAWTGNWWQYIAKSPGVVGNCWLQVRYYVWGVFKGEREPFPVTLKANFNPLQSVIYFIVMYAIYPVTLATGLIYLNPQWAPARMFGYDGLLPVALLHYLCATAILMFAIAHIYLGTMGAKLSSMYKTMITGWHEEDQGDPS